MKKIAALLVLAGAATANADVFGPGAGFAIPDNNAAGAGSTIVVSGMGLVTDVNLTITFGTGSTLGNREHTWIQDLIITLTGPGGSVLIYNREAMSPSASSSDMNGAYTFDDGAATVFTAAPAASGNIVSGTYRPVNALSVFNGSNPNGNWTLNIADRAGADVGDVVSWSLEIVPTPGAAALLGLGGLASMRRRRA